jgi:hypothetical protein
MREWSRMSHLWSAADIGFTHHKGQRASKQKPPGRYTERLFFAAPSLLVLSLGSNLVSHTLFLASFLLPAHRRPAHGDETNGALIRAAALLCDDW